MNIKTREVRNPFTGNSRRLTFHRGQWCVAALPLPSDRVRKEASGAWAVRFEDEDGTQAWVEIPDSRGI